MDDKPFGINTTIICCHPWSKLDLIVVQKTGRVSHLPCSSARMNDFFFTIKL